MQAATAFAQWGSEEPLPNSDGEFEVLFSLSHAFTVLICMNLYCTCQNLLIQKVFAWDLGWNLFSLSKALAAALRTTLASQNACGCAKSVYDETYDSYDEI